jgi:hypothetical protein
MIMIIIESLTLHAPLHLPSKKPEPPIKTRLVSVSGRVRFLGLGQFSLHPEYHLGMLSSIVMHRYMWYMVQ